MFRTLPEMPPAEVPDASVIIPTWNNVEMLSICLRSLLQYSETALQVVLHVNDGSDGTLEAVQAAGIEHTHSTENVGICKAVNSAANLCRGEFLIYLNDDMFVLPGWDRLLIERARSCGQEVPAYVSGTLIWPGDKSGLFVDSDYGYDSATFEEERLLEDFHAGRIVHDDWNGATWPPSLIHRKWWDHVGGYSEEFSPGFYSDIDFSAKLWNAGCRRFYGVGASLVYHFGESTTSKVRGRKSRSVRQARIRFLQKWGVLPSTFNRYYLRAGQPSQPVTPESEYNRHPWERLRNASTRWLTRAG